MSDFLPTIDELKREVVLHPAVSSIDNTMKCRYSITKTLELEWFLNNFSVKSTVIEYMRSAARLRVEEFFNECYGEQISIYFHDEFIERLVNTFDTRDIRITGWADCKLKPYIRKSWRPEGKEWCDWHHGYSYDDDYGNCMCCGGPRDDYTIEQLYGSYQLQPGKTYAIWD